MPASRGTIRLLVGIIGAASFATATAVSQEPPRLGFGDEVSVSWVLVSVVVSGRKEPVAGPEVDEFVPILPKLSTYQHRLFEIS